MIPKIDQKQYRSLLDIVMLSGHPLLVVGKPGIGKTRTPKHYCDEHGIKLIISHPATDSPQDIKGYPAKTTMRIPVATTNLDDMLSLLESGDADDETVSEAEQEYETMEVATFLPFGQMLEVLTATDPLIWFFDDFGHATKAVQSALMQLLGDRELCGKRLPDCVKIIAATNGREHNANVQGLLEPVKSRFGMIVELVEDLPGFREYGAKHNFYKDILFFLESSPEALCVFRTDTGMENNPNPRLWEKLSDQLYAFDKVAKGYDKEYRDELRQIMACGCVGSTYGKQYAAYERLSESIPLYEDIINDPDEFPINQKMDIRIAMLGMLATQGKPEHSREIFAYTNKLAKPFQVVFFRFLRRYNEPLLNSAHAQRWWASNLDIYID